MFSQEEYSNAFELETEQYQRGYQNDVNGLQRNLKLINMDAVVNKGRIPPNHPSNSWKNKEKKRGYCKESPIKLKRSMAKESDKTIIPFNMQNEISK